MNKVIAFGGKNCYVIFPLFEWHMTQSRVTTKVNSLFALPMFVSSSLTMVKYCKTFCFLALLGFNTSLFLKQAFLCFSLYQTDDSSMSVNMENTADAEFPALTICPDYFEAFKKNELQKFGISKGDIRGFNFMKFNSTSLNTLEQYHKVTHNLADVIEKFTISLSRALEGSKVTKVSFINGPTNLIEGSKVKLESLNEKDWITQYYQVFGRCFTYLMPDELRESQVAYIEVTVKMQSLLYIHHPGQFSWIDSDTKVPIIPTQTSFLNTMHQVVHSRPMISKRNGEWTCDPKLDKGYDDCLKDAYDKLFHWKLGCYHPFMTKTKDQEKYCNYGNFSKDDQAIYWSFYSGFLRSIDF